MWNVLRLRLQFLRCFLVLFLDNQILDLVVVSMGQHFLDLFVRMVQRQTSEQLCGGQVHLLVVRQLLRAVVHEAHLREVLAQNILAQSQVALGRVIQIKGAHLENER